MLPVYVELNEKGHINPTAFQNLGFGGWLNSSLAFSAPVMSSLPELPCSACDAAAVCSSCQVWFWRVAGAC